MILLRLFDQGDLSRQLDVRALEEGDLKIGREPGGDGWAIDDPDRVLSRAHCIVSLRDGGIRLRDTSSNGVFVGEALERPERDRDLPLHPGDVVRLGRFAIVVEQAPEGTRAPTPPDRADARGSASPFAAPSGMDAFAPEGGRRLDPFASALAPDPLSGTPDPRRAPGFDDDVWERRAEPSAGDWNAPAEGRQAGHERLIGSDRPWAEPAAPAAEKGYGFDAPFSSPLLKPPETGPDDLRIPSDWDLAAEPPPEPAPALALAPAPAQAPPPAPAEPPPPTAPAPVAAAPAPPREAVHEGAPDAAAMLAAFCAGARLDPKSLAGEDPVETMRRLGGVYQQMVLGLGDLLGERTSVKNEYRMARTMIRAEGNNPFKWSPAQRAAVEVLREGGDGFMAGPAAVQASFEDLKKHLLCMLAGLRAALGATLDALSPEAVDRELEGRSYLIPTQREAAAWREFARLHAQFRREADDNPDSPVNRAFRSAYERQLQELDSMSGRR